MPLPLLLVPLLTTAAGYLARDVLVEGASSLASSAFGSAIDYLADDDEDDDDDEENDE